MKDNNSRIPVLRNINPTYLMFAKYGPPLALALKIGARFFHSKNMGDGTFEVLILLFFSWFSSWKVCKVIEEYNRERDERERKILEEEYRRYYGNQ